MRRILAIVLVLLIMMPPFMEVHASMETPGNTYIDTKINNHMYYFSAAKTVVNDAGVAVSISESGSIATCPKLSAGDWKIITFTKRMMFDDIIVTDNKFMAVASFGLDSLLLTSGDGINWTEKDIKGYNVMKLFYINDSYFVLAIDRWRQYGLFKSADLETFERIEAANNIGINIYPKEDQVNLYISDITYFKGRYYLSGMYSTGDPRAFNSDYCQGIIISSEDLKKWEIGSKSPTMLQYMVQNSNTLIAYGGNSYSARLKDANSISSMGAVGIPETNMVHTNDGKSFGKCNISFQTAAGAFEKITCIGDKFFGITYKSIGISSDGISWTTYNGAVNWSYGGYYNGKYVAVGTDIRDKSKKIMATNTGNLNWDISECITNFSDKKRLSTVSFAKSNGGYYILDVDSTDISSDLLNWKSSLEDELYGYRKILFDGKRFVAITSDTVVSSPDGIAWVTHYNTAEERSTLSPKLYDLFFSNGKYYAYGTKWGHQGEGWQYHVWISEDLSNWDMYMLNIDNYIENTNADLNNSRIAIIGDKAVLTHAGEEKSIIAVSDDMYNFRPIMTDSPKWNMGKMYYYNNNYITFVTEAANSEDLTSNQFYTITKGSDFIDYVYISPDLKTFRKMKLPSQHIKDIYFFRDKYLFAASDYPKPKLYVTKDFISFKSYVIPTEGSNLNITGSEENIYDVFSIGDVLYITGARVIYSKDLKEWTVLDTLPSNGYMSYATKDNLAVVGGQGIMVRIEQNSSVLENEGN